MKLSSSKPISSPSRTTTMEKYPPPLMRFLRSNIGNKSRGRSSKSSPMFVRKKLTAANNSNSTTAAAAETQEPTSPKVTCIGQVRVGRSSKASSSRSCSRAVRTRKRCKWVVNALFCRNFHCGNGKCDFKSFKPILSKWVLFFRFGCREKSKLDVNCGGLEDEKVENFDRHYFAAESRFSEEQREKEHEDHHEEDEDDDEKLISCSTTPPKNALLLTRCRSAPYRSSSLATRFWASPQISTEKDVKESPETEINLNLENNASPLVVDHQASEEISVNENETELEKTGEEIDEDEDCSSVSVVVSTISRPLLLTRCKSEPASRAAADKIYPEICFSEK